jgi:hypothetical protein
MFRQNFTSDLIQYRDWPEDWVETVHGDGGTVTYVTRSYTPVYWPDLWPLNQVESIAFVRGMFTMPQPTPTSPFIICVLAQHLITSFPANEGRIHQWDGMTGAYIGAVLNPDGGLGELFNGALTQGPDGAIWQESHYITSSFFEKSRTTFAEIPGTRHYASEFGQTALFHHLVDKSVSPNLLVTTTGTDLALAILNVFDMTSKEVVRQIHLSGNVRQLVAEDDGKCFAVLTNNMVNSVNYLTGEILATFRAPLDYHASTLYAWSKQLRRFLAFSYEEDDEAGECQCRVIGFHPVPLAVKLTAPIPLRAPRKHRKIPVLVRAIGDAGEPISSTRITVTASDGATLVRFAQPDAAGDALITIQCDADGDGTVNASAEVIDT